MKDWWESGFLPSVLILLLVTFGIGSCDYILTRSALKDLRGDGTETDNDNLGYVARRYCKREGTVMAQSETSKRLKKMLRMAENLAGLSAKLGKLMEHEGIPAIEVEGCLVTHEKDPVGNDRAILRMIDERFWASLRQARDKTMRDLLAKEGGKDEL